MTKIRTDIQALRGIAVGVVVLDHFKVGPFHQGFLGVDIFFVISGFLITKIIARQIDAGTFSFVDFYGRRAKRILPAVYATILLTSIASIWFLDSVEMASLTAQVWGAITYTINFVLWSQVGYFDVSAGLKPLLHLWSLAVEEQFYIFFPVLFVVAPKRYRPLAIFCTGTLSFVACLYVASSSPTTAFYMLPMRAWELMFGAFGAIIDKRPKWLSLAFWPGVGIIATATVVGTGMPHPGIDAALVCAATLIVILAENKRFAELYPNRIILAKMGDISYSLYLVHWPIVVFMNDAIGMNASSEIRALGILASIVLAIGLHLAVEEPCRKPVLSWLGLASAVGVTGALVAIVQIGAQAYSSRQIDMAYLRRPNHGLNVACDNYIFENRKECRTSNDPTTLIWGDSYAMAAASGAQYHLAEGMVQATYSACPPFLGYAPYNPSFNNPELVAKYCIAFNDGVNTFVTQNDTLRTVVLSASFWQYTVPNYKMMRRAEDGAFLIEDSALVVTKKIFYDLIARLKLAGKQVIVIAPPPGVEKTYLDCSERLMTGRLKARAEDCDHSAVAFHQSSATVDDLMQSASQAGATIIQPSEALCDDAKCHTVIDSVLLYRDEGHLSYDGAKKVFDILGKTRQLPPPFQ